jgi:hypothetical protein
LVWQLAEARQPNPLATEQPFDAGRGTGPLLSEGFQIAVQMALILGLDRRDLDYLPHLPFPLLIAHQHAQ